VPIAEVDPADDGAWVRITELEDSGPDRMLVDVELPGGQGEGDGHCGPRDGWKRGGHGKVPRYENKSGFADQDCTVSAGLRRFTGEAKTRTTGGVTTGKVVYRMSGTRQGGGGAGGTGGSPPLPTGPVRVEVGLGTDTGPCWVGVVECDGSKRCTATSAEGAFVD
jgi:hypothetical protein